MMDTKLRVDRDISLLASEGVGIRSRYNVTDKKEEAGDIETHNPNHVIEPVYRCMHVQHHRTKVPRANSSCQYISLQLDDQSWFIVLLARSDPFVQPSKDLVMPSHRVVRFQDPVVLIWKVEQSARYSLSTTVSSLETSTREI